MQYEFSESRYEEEGSDKAFITHVTLSTDSGMPLRFKQKVEKNILLMFHNDKSIIYDYKTAFVTNEKGEQVRNNRNKDSAKFQIKIMQPTKYYKFYNLFGSTKLTFAEIFWGLQTDPLIEIWKAKNEIDKSVDVHGGGSKRKNLRITRRKKSRKRAY
jgi:hypothetical protein